MQQNRVLRLSFSKSLLDFVSSKLPGTEVVPVRFIVGDVLDKGQASQTGLYAVCKKSGWPLRVTLFLDLAESWRHETRDVRECWVVSTWPTKEVENDPRRSVSAT